MNTMINYVRMWRSATDSYMTVQTPIGLPVEAAFDWADATFPGWEAIMGSPVDPDEIEAE